MRSGWRYGAGPLVAMAATLLAPAAGVARGDPPEDEAHRVDRLQTQELNASALKRLAQPPPAPALVRPTASPPAPAPAAPPEDARLRLREDRALAVWRARAAACRAGDRKSCDRR